MSFFIDDKTFYIGNLKKTNKTTPGINGGL